MGTQPYRKPQTIEELRAFCEEKGMPLEKMRFFIGEDYRGARAFGVYQDEDGEFVVYKNKSDGSRAVRYKGPDEAYAVNELYEKLKSETELRRPVTRSAPGRQSGKTPALIAIALVLVAQIAVGAIGLYRAAHRPHRGYYAYNDRSYYYYAGDWYAYDSDLLYWLLEDEVDPYFEENYADYYLDDDYDAGYGVADFEESGYWRGSDYDDSDDDYDWGSGSDWDSWDSSDTDWDSDW